MFKYLTRLIKAMNANTHPGDIAHAVALGLMLALVPKGNLLWPFLFILALFIRMNKGAFFLSLIAFSFIVPFADVPLERFGNIVLTIPVLQPIFSEMYRTPFVGLTRFNNTMVAGSFLAGCIAYVPVYLLMRLFLSLYRKKLQPIITNSKLYKLILKIPLVKKIADTSGIGGIQS